MNICINYGHALTGAGTGAVSLKKESEETRCVGKKVVEMLKANSSHQIFVADFNGEDNYVKAVAFANANNIDLFVSIHFNCGANDTKGNGSTTGTEVLVGHTGSSAYDEAQRIATNISKLGLKNRGVKLRPDLYVLKHTKMGACLVECAFLDDLDDMKVYNANTMAKAITEGILGKAISDSKPSTEVPNTNDKVIYRVVAGSYSVRENAQAQLDKLNKLGIEGCFLTVK